MAIKADILVKGYMAEGVYIRPQSIGGSKPYDWACTFAIFANAEMSQDFNNYLDTITVRFGWEPNQDVYSCAYQALKDSGHISNYEDV